MKITKEEILHVANLARLEIDGASIGKFAEQIGNILDYVDQLRQVDTSGIKPMSHALALTYAFREDAETKHLERETSLSNAPEQEDGSFVVPKVVG
jgi:aspartyl-tRNA(Asn)/glutamyl-tRNA(Gln) amidotransferase subunit C